MEENNNLNEMNTQQPVVENSTLENPVADMTPVPSTPTVTITPDSSAVIDTSPVASVVENPAPAVESSTPVMNTPVTPTEASTPVMETSAPVVENPASVVENPAPAPETTPQSAGTSNDGNAPVAVEKKKAPVNIVAVIIIIVCCVLGGYILHTRYGSKPEPTPTPTPNPVVTPTDDPTVDPINPPTAMAEKYSTVVDGIEYTFYLKQNEGVFYYLKTATVNGLNIMTGNYGKYTEVDANLHLQSEIYFDVPCYYTSADAINGPAAGFVFDYIKDVTANTLTSSDGQMVFTYQGSEEITNPLQIEELHVCDNLENAN